MPKHNKLYNWLSVPWDLKSDITVALDCDIKPLVSSSSMKNREAGYSKCPGAPGTSKKLSLVILRIRVMAIIH